MNTSNDCLCSGIGVCALGTTLAIFNAICLFSLGMAAHFFGYGIPVVTLMSSVYPGYDMTISGSLIGLGYGLVVGFIEGAVIAKLYNCHIKWCCCAKGVKMSCCNPSDKAMP